MIDTFRHTDAREMRLNLGPLKRSADLTDDKLERDRQS